MIKQIFFLSFLLMPISIYAQENNQTIDLNQKIYGGTYSQQGNRLQLEDKKDKKGRASIQWIGFEMKSNGGSRIFIKSSAPIEFHELNATEGSFALEFDKSRLITRNDQREIDTSYFYTVVQNIKAVQKDANTVNLFLKLREECEPKIIVEGNYIYIDLPVPQKVPAVYEEDEENSKLKINTTP
jgi:hypothetical protein